MGLVSNAVQKHALKYWVMICEWQSEALFTKNRSDAKPTPQENTSLVFKEDNVTRSLVLSLARLYLVTLPRRALSRILV